MKKALPYIVIGAALYYFWWKYNQSMTNNPEVKPRDTTLLETDDGSPLIRYGSGVKLNGFPTIF